MLNEAEKPFWVESSVGTQKMRSPETIGFRGNFDDVTVGFLELLRIDKERVVSYWPSEEILFLNGQSELLH
jgi:hypothetical protein